MIICEACGEECRIITVDYGIGVYEYWGATGFDRRLADVTNCCEAGWIEDLGPDEYITEMDMAR